jgi:preprotein translocase subunit YajC
MFAIFIVITIFALVLTICLTIVEDKRRKYENKQLKNNLKKFDNVNRL